MKFSFRGERTSQLAGPVSVGLFAKGTDHGHLGIPDLSAGWVCQDPLVIEDSKIPGLKAAVGVRTKKSKLHDTRLIARKNLGTVGGMES